MEPTQGNAVVREIARPQHEGHVVAVLEINGREAFVASQVSEALGYEDPKQVSIAVLRDLDDETEEGVTHQVLRGEELALLKQVAPDLVDPRAPSVMVLFEPGVYLVAMRARTEKAKSFRRWLAEDVLPSIRRTGGYGRQAPGLSTEDVVRIATQAATTAASVIVEQVLERMGAPSGAQLDLDANDDAVRRAREMRHLAVRHRRAGRRLAADRLEAQATQLLLGDTTDPGASSPLGDVAATALRHLMAEVKANPSRFYTQGPEDPSTPPAGVWWGRTDAYTLALVAPWVDTVLRTGGFHPAQVRSAWRARLWLHVQESGRGHTSKVRLGGKPSNCIVFPLDILKAQGVL